MTEPSRHNNVSPDIVEWLHHTAGHLINGAAKDGTVEVAKLCEAADEIDRLRSALNDAEDRADLYANSRPVTPDVAAEARLLVLVEKAMDEWENDREAPDTGSCAHHIAISIAATFGIPQASPTPITNPLVLPAGIKPGYYTAEPDDALAVSRPLRCSTCDGRGTVGGFVNATSGYQDDACPDCSPLSSQQSK